MITAILDTNVILQSLLSESESSSVRVLESYFDGEFNLVFSQETLDELIEVLSLERLRARHRLSDDGILELVNSLLDNGRCVPVTGTVSAQLPRDITDTKFLALAKTSGADYLVTNDGRHLLPIGVFHGTKIVRPSEFLAVIASQKSQSK